MSAANAANAARTTRQPEESTAEETSNRRAVRERMTVFFAAAR